MNGILLQIQRTWKLRAAVARKELIFLKKKKKDLDSWVDTNSRIIRILSTPCTQSSHLLCPFSDFTWWSSMLIKAKVLWQKDATKEICSKYGLLLTNMRGEMPIMWLTNKPHWPRNPLFTLRRHLELWFHHCSHRENKKRVFPCHAVVSPAAPP